MLMSMVSKVLFVQHLTILNVSNDNLFGNPEEMSGRKVLDELISVIESQVTQIEGGQLAVIPTSVFTLEDFFYKLCVHANSLSNEVTKVCIILSNRSSPKLEEVLDIWKKIESDYLDLINLFRSLPKEKGLTLRGEIQRAFLKLSETLIDTLRSFQNKNVRQNGSLTLTWLVREACESFNSFPRDNLEATAKVLKREQAMILDALQEIEDEVKAVLVGESNKAVASQKVATWTSEQKEMIPPVIGLAKVAKSCFKKVKMALEANGNCNTQENVSQLDELVSSLKKLSPAVDNLISSLYPPVDKNVVKCEGESLTLVIMQLFKLVQSCHFFNSNDQEWADFLMKATDYNNQKLQMCS